MQVIKRNNKKEPVQFDKITNRIRKLIKCEDIDPILITQKLSSRIYPGITTTELDILASQICMAMIMDNPDFGILGGRIAISNHQKNTDNDFLTVMFKLANNLDIHGELSPLINEEAFEISRAYEKEINNIIDMDRDFLLDFFGFKTLERSYLLKAGLGNDKKIVERPQHLFMRVAIGIHGNDMENVKKLYDNISLKRYTHATPTLFNAAGVYPQMSSCYLQSIEDSIEGIFETYRDCGLISKWAGGIGIHISNIRAKGSYIRKTGGQSDGIMTLLKTFNSVARQFNQCFAPNTIVYTTNGPKRIDNITEGDKVITLDGTSKSVMAIKKTHVNKEVLRIKSVYSADYVTVTPEHEIYVLKGQKKKIPHSEIINKLISGKLKGEFIPAKDMTTDDIVCYPIPKIETEKCNLVKDQCRFYGIIMGDGYLSKKNKINIEGGVILCYSKDKTIKFVRDFLVKYDCQFLETEGVHCIQIRWEHTSNVFGFCYDDLYDNNHKKYISNSFLKMDETNSISLIHGLIEASGHVGKEIYCTSTNMNLVESLRYLLLKLGVLSSGFIKSSPVKNITNKKLLYTLRIPKVSIICDLFGVESSKKLGYFQHNGVLYSKIKSISKLDYSGLVYDLNIQDNHNYLTQMGLVHNSGKRMGSFAIYIEPHHPDIFTFLDAKKNQGDDNERAKDLFYALWVPDLFMKRLENNEKWSLFCPDRCPGLNESVGDDYVKLYEKYEKEGKFNKQIDARDLWKAVISSQIETGTPYILYKDACNLKSNQQNLGVIKSSNLCVAGDTKILTKEGYYSIKDLQDKDVEVWNGKEWSFTNVRKTGENIKLITVELSNGVKLKCTEYHKFYVQDNQESIRAIDLRPDMIIQQYLLPSGYDDILENLFIRTVNNSHEVTPTNLIRVDNLSVKIVEDYNEFGDTYCFNETSEHKGIFNGILTGNCSEIIQYSSKLETACCNLASICLSSILKKPTVNNITDLVEWSNLLSEDNKRIFNSLFTGTLKLFSKEDCLYCKLLKSLLKDTGLIYEEINSIEAEKYRIMSRPVPSVMKPFETVPQLFVEDEGKVYHIGGYEETWEILKPRVDHELLYSLSYELIENLNKVIDKNFYPIDKTRSSNMLHRPVGVGVQGLADLFMSLKLPFDSDSARSINKDIFETMYFGAMTASCDLAKKEGAYSTFKGSPLSNGNFQFNLWGLNDSDLSGRWDWGRLRDNVIDYGVRNSLLIALMPTASTSQIMGSVAEAFEPITSNLYARRTLAGEFTVINPYLIKDLISLDIWNEDTKNRLQYDRGSVQNIKGLPKFLKDIYRTAYEIPQKSIITMSAERGPFVCQSQSLNLFFEKPDFRKLTASHFLGWKLGLKTGSYYIRSKPAINSQRFGMDIAKEQKMKDEDDKECLSCGA